MQAANVMTRDEEDEYGALEESYDDFPYESYCYPQTHPERMYTIGRLFNLSPPDIATARILEIGCACGGNLIPLAILYPETKSLGIDLSREQIALANEDKKALKLKNIEFRQMDVTKFGEDQGEFDYIICHGVFSWVPAQAREAIFDVCRKHLSPDGLAVISYNTLPGWAAVKSLREMMLFHTRNFESPSMRIKEAGQLLNFLYENASPANEAYRQIIDRERKILNSTNDSYVLHEHLELENNQFYLHEFATMATENGLAYVGDAEISSMYVGNLSENARNTLAKIKDIVRQEQYIDFLMNRRFRHTILTRAENAPKIRRNLTPSRIMDFFVQARFRPAPQAGAPNQEMRFKSVSGESFFTTRDKDATTVMTALAEANRPVRINDFAQELEKKEKISSDAARRIMLKNGFVLLLQNFISLHAHECEFAVSPGKKPKAFSWARHVARKKGKGSANVANLKRESMNLSPFLKAILENLDGKTDRKTIIKNVTDRFVSGGLSLRKGDKKISDPKEIAALVDQQLDEALTRMARLALLES